jgi:hypothetical protein
LIHKYLQNFIQRVTQNSTPFSHFLCKQLKTKKLKKEIVSFSFKVCFSKKMEYFQNQKQQLQIVVLTTEQLNALLQENVRLAVSDYFNGNNQISKPSKQDDELLTAQEVMKILHITEPTLLRRDKEKVLTPHFTGRKKLYSKSEVMNFLNGKVGGNE